MWTGDFKELEEFHTFLNSIDNYVKFTLVWSRESLQFLDIKVYFADGRLCIELFRKEMDKNTLLRFDSCHPHKMNQSLPYSQMLHARRIVDDEAKIDGTLTEIVQNFQQRGFPQDLISTQINNVKGHICYIVRKLINL